MPEHLIKNYFFVYICGMYDILVHSIVNLFLCISLKNVFEKHKIGMEPNHFACGSSDADPARSSSFFVKIYLI